MYVLFPCKYGNVPIKNSRENAWTAFFSIQCLWETSVTIATRIPNQSASKSDAGNPHHNDASDKV